LEYQLDYQPLYENERQQHITLSQYQKLPWIKAMDIALIEYAILSQEWLLLNLIGSKLRAIKSHDPTNPNIITSDLSYLISRRTPQFQGLIHS
jgi:hypothetical protein